MSVVIMLESYLSKPNGNRKIKSTDPIDRNMNHTPYGGHRVDQYKEAMVAHLDKHYPNREMTIILAEGETAKGYVFIMQLHAED